MNHRWASTGILALSVVAGPVIPVAAASEGRGGGAAVPNPTFTKDVAPIFQDKCESCHRPGSIAPMSLVTYEEARPWARSIKARVSARQMPPWHIDRTVGIQHFQNDRSLSDDQIDTIVRWVDAGMPKGDSTDMPAPKQWPDGQGWNFAAQFGQKEPDLIVKSYDFTMPAVSQDKWFRPTVPIGLTEPRWVRAIEMRPVTVKGRRIIHHAMGYLQQEEPSDSPVGAGVFMEWSVGKQGELMRPDSGRLLLPGSSIQFEVHLHAVGEEISDSVELGVYLYPKAQQPKYRQVLTALMASHGLELDLPPNQITVTENFSVMKMAGRVENFQPHMHLRGKAMSLEAILPDGTRQMLSFVRNFTFYWMNNYVYADEATPLLPKGTVLHVTAWHDNTVANKDNPDPNQWVGWGDRTVDEMAHAWVNISYLSDADFKAEVEKRKAGDSKTAPH